MASRRLLRAPGADEGSGTARGPGRAVGCRRRLPAMAVTWGGRRRGFRRRGGRRRPAPTRLLPVRGAPREAPTELPPDLRDGVAVADGGCVEAAGASACGGTGLRGLRWRGVSQRRTAPGSRVSGVSDRGAVRSDVRAPRATRTGGRSQPRPRLGEVRMISVSVRRIGYGAPLEERCGEKQRDERDRCRRCGRAHEGAVSALSRRGFYSPSRARSLMGILPALCDGPRTPDASSPKFCNEARDLLGRAHTILVKLNETSRLTYEQQQRWVPLVEKALRGFSD